MPSGARCGTRPWRTVGRPVPRRSRVRPCERSWRAASRPWQPSRISRRAVPRRSRPSTSGSTCECALILGEIRQMLDCLRELATLAQALDDQPRLGRVSAHMCRYLREWGTDGAVESASKPSPSLRPRRFSLCKSWRITTWVWPTILWATIVGRWGCCGAMWSRLPVI